MQDAALTATHAYLRNIEVPTAEQTAFLGCAFDAARRPTRRRVTASKVTGEAPEPAVRMAVSLRVDAGARGIRTGRLRG
jgi:hypothetical protein